MNQLRTPEDALRFALDFAQLDLQPTHLGALHRHALAFVSRDWAAPRDTRLPTHALPAPFPLDLPAWQTLQRDVRAFLSALVLGGHPVRWRTADGAWTVREALPTAVALGPLRYLVTVHHRRTVSVLATGATRDVFLHRLIRLVEHLGIEKVRLCRATDCARLFLKVTRKEFCSTRCQSKIYMRQFRAQQKGSRRHDKTTRKR